MTITKQVTTVEEVTIDVALPYYCKSNTDKTLYKVVTEDYAIAVLDFEHYPGILRHPAGSAFKDSSEIEPQEFYEAYARVYDRMGLAEIISIHRLEQDRELWREVTADYLDGREHDED